MSPANTIGAAMAALLLLTLGGCDNGPGQPPPPPERQTAESGPEVPVVDTPQAKPHDIPACDDGSVKSKIAALEARLKEVRGDLSMATERRDRDQTEDDHARLRSGVKSAQYQETQKLLAGDDAQIGELKHQQGEIASEIALLSALKPCPESEVPLVTDSLRTRPMPPPPGPKQRPLWQFHDFSCNHEQLIQAVQNDIDNIIREMDDLDRHIGLLKARPGAQARMSADQDRKEIGLLQVQLKDAREERTQLRAWGQGAQHEVGRAPVARAPVATPEMIPGPVATPR